MSWITLIATDLDAIVVAEQMDALRQEALRAGQGDPFDAVAPDVIRSVRAYIASNVGNQIDTEALTIPAELKLDVCYLIVSPMCGRLGIPLTDDQRAAVKRADDKMKLIAAGTLKVSNPDVPVTPAVQSGGNVEVVASTTRTASSRTLRNL